MNMITRSLFAFVLLIWVFPTASLYAWRDHGHEIIGVIAYARLTPKVRKRVDAILAADRDDLTAADFVSRTTWADKYRDSDRNTTKSRYKATRNWHFVDIEITDGDLDSACNHHPQLPNGSLASAGPAEACLVDKIDQFITEIRNPAIGRPEKTLALKFLLHLIGDLHQPFHVADNHDRGGNEMPVRFGDGDLLTNLHFYWDYYLVEYLGNDSRTVGASLNRQISKTQADTWSKGTVTDWAQDTFTQAKTVAYNFSGLQPMINDNGAVGIRIDKAYNDRAMPVLQQQLCKAGVRLAAILNNFFR